MTLRCFTVGAGVIGTFRRVVWDVIWGCIRAVRWVGGRFVITLVGAAIAAVRRGRLRSYVGLRYIFVGHRSHIFWCSICWRNVLRSNICWWNVCRSYVSWWYICWFNISRFDICRFDICRFNVRRLEICRLHVGASWRNIPHSWLRVGAFGRRISPLTVPAAFIIFIPIIFSWWIFISLKILNEKRIRNETLLTYLFHYNNLWAYSGS